MINVEDLQLPALITTLATWLQVQDGSRLQQPSTVTSGSNTWQ